MPEIYSTYERKNTHRRTHQTKTERQRPYHIMACQKDKLRSQQFLQKIEKQQHREIDLLFRISEILQEDFFAGYSEMLCGKIHHKNVSN